MHLIDITCFSVDRDNLCLFLHKTVVVAPNRPIFEEVLMRGHNMISTLQSVSKGKGLVIILFSINCNTGHICH